MAGGGKTTTTNEVKLPEWLNRGSQTTFEGAVRAADANPIRAFTGPLSAASNANLDGASAIAREGQAAGVGDLEMARRLTAGASTQPTGRVSTQDWNGEQASRYMNPYLEQVQGRVLTEMNRQNRGVINDVGDSALGSRAFGGTRHAVLEAETRSGQNRNIMDFLAQSNQQGYDDSYGRFASDRSSRQGAESTNANLEQGDFLRMMQGGGQFANLANTASGLRSSSINDLIRTGAVQQNTEGERIDADYGEFLRMQDAPIQRYQQLMAMLTGAQTNRSETQTTRQKNGILNTVLGGAGLAASIASDRRLKRDIRPEGKLGEFNLYSYRYLWSKDRTVGVMADEVKKVLPQAVKRIFGFDMVDYSMLLGREAVS